MIICDNCGDCVKEARNVVIEASGLDAKKQLELDLCAFCRNALLSCNWAKLENRFQNGGPRVGR